MKIANAATLCYLANYFGVCTLAIKEFMGHEMHPSSAQVCLTEAMSYNDQQMVKNVYIV